MNVQGQAQCGDPGFIIALDRGGADGNSVFPDDGGDLTEHIHPVVSKDGNGGIEGIAAVAGPFHGNTALLLTCGGIDALRLMDGNAAAAGDITHNFVSGDRTAALGEADRNIQILAAGEDDTVMRTVLAEALFLRDHVFHGLDGLRGLFLGLLFLDQAGDHIDSRHTAVTDGTADIIEVRETGTLQDRIVILRFGNVGKADAAAHAFLFNHGAAGFNILFLERLLQELADLGLGLGCLTDTKPVGARAAGGRGCQDLHPVAGFQRGIQGNDLAVDLRADALVADGGVDTVGKVQGSGPLGHGDNISLGGKEEYFLGEKVGFQGIQEFTGIPGLCLPVQHLPDPVELMVQVILPVSAFLVAPVRRDTEFRDAVHFPGADLHFEGEGDLAAAYHGGVEGLVHVGLGHGNIILEPAGNLVPQGMDNTEDGIAVRNGVHDNPDGDQVVDLVKGFLLQDHLPVDGIEMLAAAVNVVADMLLVQPLGKLIDDQTDAFLPFLALHADQVNDAVVSFRINVLQGKVFQLLLDGIDAQAVRQGSIDIQCFPGNGYPAVFRLETERAHVVQAVRQLDQHDPDIPGHGQDHFPEGFSLGFLPVGEVQFVQLGNAVHKVRNLITELCTECFEGDAFAVFNGIMKKPRSNRRGIDHQFSQNGCHQAGVGEISLTGLAELAFMGLFGKLPGFFHELIAIAGVILPYTPEHLVQGHCLIGCKSQNYASLREFINSEFRIMECQDCLYSK